MPRKHRRVHHPRTDCRCPEGAKRIATQKGRSFGCIAKILAPGAKKPVPRFVKLICGPEAGEVKQWKPPPGHQRRPKKGQQMVLHWNKPEAGPQLLLNFKRKTITPVPPLEPEQILLRYNNNRKAVPADDDKTPSWWRL